MTTLPLLVRFIVGLSVLVLLGGLSTLGLERATGAFDDTVEVTLTVEGNVGQGLDTFSDVRIRGVRVGSVEGIELTEAGQARVTIGLEPDLDLPASTRASIEPLSVFGPKSVELQVDLTDTGPRLAAGDDLAVLDPPTELSELIVAATEILEAVDPAQLRAVQRALADGLIGRGGSIRQGLDAADDLTRVLDDRDATAAALIGDLRTLTDDLADRGPAATRAARSLRDGLPVIADTEEELAVLLDDTTRVTGDVARTLRAQADEFDPLLTGLERTTRLLSRRLDDTIDLVALFDDVFRLIDDAAQLDGPGDTRQAGIDAVLDEDLCLLIEGLCDDLPAGSDQLLRLRPIGDLLADLGSLLPDLDGLLPTPSVPISGGG